MSSRWVPRAITALVLTLTLAGIAVQGLAQSEPQEALAGFDNLTNGFEQQKAFDDDKKAFDDVEEVFPKKKLSLKVQVDPATGKPIIDPVTHMPMMVTVQDVVRGGLGPVYNSTSCTGCHQNSGFVEQSHPGAKFHNTNDDTGLTLYGNDAVSGPHGQTAEIRAGHDERREVTLDDFTRLMRVFVEAPGGSVIQQRAIDPRIQETVPPREDIRTLRLTTNTLGDGFVEFITDEAIEAMQRQQDASVRGTISWEPVALSPDGSVYAARAGRFGWKSQEASLLNFAAGAYQGEMGITSPLQRKENSSLGRSVAGFDPLKDPEDDGGENGFGEDVEAFTRFMRSTHVPPRGEDSACVRRGQKLFEHIGCGNCHIPTWTTAQRLSDLPLDPISMGKYVNPKTLLNKIIHPFSDFMLHDIGTGDGIVQPQFSDRPPYGLNPIGTTPATVPGAFIRAPSLKNGAPNDPLTRLNRLLHGFSEPGSRNSNEALDRAARAKESGRTAAIQCVGYYERSRSALLPDEADEGDRMVFTRQTANMIRTAPLWGLRTRPQLLHDGRALTIQDAIKAHRGQARRARARFDGLTHEQKQDVLDFLKSL